LLILHHYFIMILKILVGNDSQKQLNDRLDLMLKQSERQFHMLNELMTSLNIQQKNSQENVNPRR